MTFSLENYVTGIILPPLGIPPPVCPPYAEVGYDRQNGACAVAVNGFIVVARLGFGGRPCSEQQEFRNRNPKPRTLKRRFIKDPVWGNIEVLHWETDLLESFLLTRLHNVVQNSSAFKIYPGLRHSRFCHTLGVTHVAAQMFVNIILNSEPAAVGQLKREAKEVENQIPSEAADLIRDNVTQLFRCPAEYACLFAVVRLGAILHDVGHLPYSHVFEHALEAFLSNRFRGLDSIESTASERRSELTKALDTLQQTDDALRDAKLHEVLGCAVIRMLGCRVMASHLQLKPLLQLVYKMFVQGQLPATRSVISGTLDADRIDFVRRDGLFSGLQGSAVDYGRLFACYELGSFSSSGGHQVWAVRPSIRARSEAEKLLTERFQTYKYIVSHHRVHFFDEVMERLLLRLLCSGKLNNLLDTLLGIVNSASEDFEEYHPTESQERGETFLSLLYDFDDSWLDYQIRQAVRDLRKSGHKSGEAKAVLELFDAYNVSARKYVSLFKRDDDYDKTLRAIRPEWVFDGTSESANIRAKILPYVQKIKYRVEEKLKSELGVVAIVGDVASKANNGVRDSDAARFIGVTGVVSHLSEKIKASALFNVWYVSSSGKNGQQATHGVLEKVVDYIEAAIQEDLSKAKERHAAGLDLQ